MEETKGRLIVTISEGEELCIGKAKISYFKAKGRRIRISIVAPKDMKILFPNRVKDEKKA